MISGTRHHCGLQPLPATAQERPGFPPCGRNFLHRRDVKIPPGANNVEFWEFSSPSLSPYPR